MLFMYFSSSITPATGIIGRGRISLGTASRLGRYKIFRESEFQW